MTFDEALRIIEDYGAVLESATHAPFVNVIDARNLPHPKQRIKQALIMGIQSTTDLPKREQLKVGLLYLADWQDGVGKDPVGLKFRDMDLNADIKELADRVVSGMADWKYWEKVVKAERDEMELELREKGLW